MTKSQIFSTAHIAARKAVTAGLAYRAGFAAGLRAAYAALKAPARAVLSTAAKLDSLLDIVLSWPRNLRNTFAFRFICDNAARAEKYGDKALFSDKQITIIDEMFVRYC